MFFKKNLMLITDSVNYSEICNDVMQKDQAVRYVGVLGRSGEMLTEKYRHNVQSILNEEETRMARHYASAKWEMRKTLEHKIGKEKMAISIYNNITQISVPLNNQELLLISLDTDYDQSKIIDKFINIASTFQKINEWLNQEIPIEELRKKDSEELIKQKEFLEQRASSFDPVVKSIVKQSVTHINSALKEIC